MTLLIIKTFFYFALIILAYACIQTANAMSKSACKCSRIALILMIVSCGTVSTSVFYNLHIGYLLLSLIPMIVGIALWMIVSNAEIHHKLDKLTTYFKSWFVRRVVRQ